MVETIYGCESKEREYVWEKLRQYNRIHTESDIPQNYEELNIILKDDSGEIQGGILAVVKWNFMQVNILWVDESVCGKGYGSHLLSLVEERAKEHGCVCVKLDTFSFQALDFYKKLGYEVFGEIEYLPNRFAQYYMVKWLNGNETRLLKHKGHELKKFETPVDA
jgi:ribosomal protein S18 acetylase RimI-like enzyme